MGVKLDESLGIGRLWIVDGHRIREYIDDEVP